MDRCKYVVFSNGFEEIPLLFPSFVQHSEVARSFPHLVPISAGFVSQTQPDGKIEASGESLSLNLKSRAQDTNLLRSLLGFWR